MWKGFKQAEGWQYISKQYSSNDTEVHILKMYRFQSSITQSKYYAFKVITISHPTTIISNKSISHVSLKSKDVNKVKTQIMALERLRGYASIIELYEVVSDEGEKEFFSIFLKKPGKNRKNVCLLMQYCPYKSLKEYISTKTMCESQIIELCLQLFECLIALKESQILHRDLRSVNLMISDVGILKLIDFDCAFIRGCSSLDIITFAFVQSATAPELIELINASQEVKSQLSADDMYFLQQKCDLYSFGTIIYQMITKQEYKDIKGSQNVLQQANCSEQLKSLVQFLLKEQSQRLDLNQTEAYLKFLSKKFNIVYRQRQRKQTKQSIHLPRLQADPSNSSQSISNSISHSDWSLDSASTKQMETSNTSKQIHRNTTIYDVLSNHNNRKTINE